MPENEVTKTVQSGREQALLLVSDRMRSHTHFLRRHADAELQKHQPSLVFPLPRAPLHKSHGNLENQLPLSRVPHCFPYT